MKLTLLSLIITLISCNQNKNETTSLSGGIVNPKDPYVILLKDNEVLDSAKLDNNGHFKFDLNINEAGLFTFKHDYEFQTLFLEPKDSLNFRLNTLEFDESLVFSGDRSHENNFLIENYLLNQNNNDLILSYYKISPSEFEFKTDSIKKVREEKLEALNSKFNFDEKFIELAQKSINYEYYDMRERYAFLLNKYNHKKALTLDDSFFEYRDQINFDDQTAMYLIGYQRFLDNYLKNRSIKICELNRNHSNCYNLDSYANLDDRIHLVDSLIKDKHIRKKYFERFIQEEIIYAEAPEHLAHTKELIDKFDFEEPKQSRLKALVDFQSALIVNADLKDVKVKCSSLKTHRLEDIMDKELGLVYSWSIQSPSHHKLRIKEINRLKKKYPDVKFIGINIDHNFPEKWLDAVEMYDYNENNEYLIDPEKHAPFYRNYLNKIFFINKDCIIKKSEIILSNNDLEKHIKGFTQIASTN